MLDAITYLSVITCALELNYTHSAIKTVATKESQISHLGSRADLTASQNPPLPPPSRGAAKAPLITREGESPQLWLPESRKIKLILTKLGHELGQICP